MFRLPKQQLNHRRRILIILSSAKKSTCEKYRENNNNVDMLSVRTDELVAPVTLLFGFSASVESLESEAEPV